ncbi:GNAT family N-acetyltransferase [Arthrobacter sp. B0490]|uniref:GNAT family N-acetyltransferase n=1 Tax=Arthrobacter sp. B0490 TaxID=2058891 RepID=UPI000CE3D052|nr:N-acetyltransferase [Arthrobacter sp. B0490]
MTELLHPAQAIPAHPATPRTSQADHRFTASTETPNDTLASEVRPVAQDPGSAVFLDELSAQEIQGLSTRHLRVLADRAYQLMDTDYPPAGAVSGYRMIVDELDGRAQHAARRGPVHQLRETFHDNQLYGRFELLIDGSLAVYIKYTMTGCQVVLTDGVEHPGFRDQGMDAILMRHIVLNAHKRRLSLIPQCPMAFSFLADHPQYQTLTARPAL